MLISDQQVTEAFSTLLRRPGLRASNGGVLATERERKMLASTCLYSLYAWLSLYKTLVGDTSDVKQRFADTWVSMLQSVVDEATDQ